MKRIKPFQNINLPLEEKKKYLEELELWANSKTYSLPSVDFGSNRTTNALKRNITVIEKYATSRYVQETSLKTSSPCAIASDFFLAKKPYMLNLP